MNGFLMQPLARMLAALGYNTRCFTYGTVGQTLPETAQSLIGELADFKENDAVDFIGHSLGGLLIRHLLPVWREGFSGSRVITLGTPHQGSRFARRVQTHLPAFLLGGSWPEGLDGSVPPWDCSVPLLSVAGTRAVGLGALACPFFAEEDNDGTVLLSETYCEGMREHRTVQKTHIEMIYSPDIAQLCHNWLQNNPA